MRSFKTVTAVAIATILISSACTAGAPTASPGSTTPGTGTSGPTTGATSPGAPSGGPLYGGTLVYADWQDLPTCNAAVTSETPPVMNVFDHLARFDADLELQPELAERWEVSEDGKTITFHLRDGVSWHDGEPFTSEDVKVTWESSLMVHHARGRVANEAVESIETPDDLTVVFNLSRPSPGFLFQIGVGESPIIPAHIYANEDAVTGPHATCEELPIGTGPFRAVEHVPGERFVMERNDDWWGSAGTHWDQGAPYLDRIIVTIVPDETARVNGFETGDFHFLYHGGVPAHEFARLGAIPGREISFDCTGISPQAQFQFNLRNEDDPWHDVRVRQAIAWAIDREQMKERANFGVGTVTPVFLAPDDPEYNPNIETYMPRDLDRANALLDEAGWPRDANGIRFQMRSTAYTGEADYPEVLRQQLAEVGIEVIVESLPRELQIEKVFVQHDFDTNWFGAGINFPGVGVARLYVSSNIGENPYNNASAYSDPEMDELWATYNSTLDPNVRRETVWRIQEKIQEDLPTITVLLNDLSNAQNTDLFSGYPSDCNHKYGMLRSVWSKSGSPTRP